MKEIDGMTRARYSKNCFKGYCAISRRPCKLKCPRKKMFLFSGKAWSEYGYVKKTTLHVKVSRGRLEKEGLGSSHQVKNISRAGPDNG